MSDPTPSPAPHDDGTLAATASSSDDVATGERPGRSIGRIPRQFGRYRLGDCLGRGGMGAVFKAHDTQLDRLVALKVPFLAGDDQETLQRFYREARAAATLQHANICSVFDVGEFQGVPYLTMAFIEGRSLNQAILAGQSFTYPQIALLMRKLALAMHEAHSHGVVHRDLKPANVLLRPNGEPVIMDFGLARRADDQRSHGITQEGDILGTLDYMSPEQAEGDQALVGAPADQYALGTILYELLTGRRPFKGTTANMLVQILTKDPPKPSELRDGIPPRLEAICLKAMAKKPGDRYPSMGHFAAALTEFLRNPQHAAPAIVPSVASNTAVQETAKVGPKTEMPKAVDKTPLDEGERPSATRTSSRSGTKKHRSGKRRKADKTSILPFVIVGGIGLLSMLLIGVGVLAFMTRSNGDKDAGAVAIETSARAPIPSAVNRGSSGGRPTGPPVGSGGVGAGTPRGNPPATKPEPKAGPGFELRAEPEQVALHVGEPRKVILRANRKEYQGPINVRWTDAPSLRIAPAGAVTIKPGQSEAEMTMLILNEAAPGPFRIELVASYEGESRREPVKASLAVNVTTGGACVRVVELPNRDKFVPETIAFAPDLSVALVGGTAARVEAAPGRGGPADPPVDANAIYVLNLERGELIGKMDGHRDRVNGLAFSGDGRFVLSYSNDETIALWDASTGKRKNQSNKQGLRILNAAMSPDAKRGLIVYAGIVVRVNLDTFQAMGQPLAAVRLTGSSLPDALRVAAISTEQHKGLVGGLEGKLFVLDLVEKGKAALPKALVGHDEAVLAAVFAPGGNFAATGGGGVLRAGTLQRGKDNVVRLWDMTTNEPSWKGEGHTDSVLTLAFSNDGRWLASGAADGVIKVWSVADGRNVATFTGYAGNVVGLRFAPDGRTLWSGSADRTLRLWRLP